MAPTPSPFPPHHPLPSRPVSPHPFLTHGAAAPHSPCPTEGLPPVLPRRLWGMGLLCMSEPLKEQPSDVLIFTLTFPALSALGCLQKVIPMRHGAAAEAVTLSQSALVPCTALPAAFTPRPIAGPSLFALSFPPFSLRYPQAQVPSMKPSPILRHPPFALLINCCAGKSKDKHTSNSSPRLDLGRKKHRQPARLFFLVHQIVIL